MDWTQVVVVLIVQIFGLITLWMKQRQTEEKVDKIDAKVEVVHKATNSLVTQLVEKTDAAARSEGTAAGRAALEKERGLS